MTAVLEVRNLTKFYRGRGVPWRRTTTRAVDGVSFSVEPGETLAVVGESGAGKSTTGLLALRLIDPDEGTILFQGQDVRSLRTRQLRRWRRRAQMVFQDPFGSFDARMTIGQSLVEPLVIHDKLARSKRRETALAILERFGFNGSEIDRFPYEFSGGQLQRLAIARAIACEPALLVCDEPVAALDMSIQAQILNLLKDLQVETGIAMLFISHDLSLVRTVADRIAVMYNGRIVEMGTTAEVYGAPQHPYTAALLSAVPVPNPRLQRGREAVKLVETRLVASVGCAFGPRCPHAMDICRTDAPNLAERADGTWVACHLEVLPRAAPVTQTDNSGGGERVLIQDTT
jgi:oligopeptide/dipeptide ABC transporter ATP-binding protein